LLRWEQEKRKEHREGRDAALPSCEGECQGAEEEAQTEVSFATRMDAGKNGKGDIVEEQKDVQKEGVVKGEDMAKMAVQETAVGAGNEEVEEDAQATAVVAQGLEEEFIKETKEEVEEEDMTPIQVVSVLTSNCETSDHVSLTWVSTRDGIATPRTSVPAADSPSIPIPIIAAASAALPRENDELDQSKATKTFTSTSTRTAAKKIRKAAAGKKKKKCRQIETAAAAAAAVAAAAEPIPAALMGRDVSPFPFLPSVEADLAPVEIPRSLPPLYLYSLDNSVGGDREEESAPPTQTAPIGLTAVVEEKVRMVQVSAVDAVIAKVEVPGNDSSSSTTATNIDYIQGLLVSPSVPSLLPSPSTWDKEEEKMVPLGRSHSFPSFEQCMSVALFPLQVLRKGVDLALNCVKEGGLLVVLFGRRVWKSRIRGQRGERGGGGSWN